MRLVVLLIVLGLAACEQDGPEIPEIQYASTLIGSWQGVVAGQKETISFNADGSFTSELYPTGFISDTLGQGETGSIDGSWTLQGNVITLIIENAENEQPLNQLSTSSIVSFNQNKLVVHSADAGSSAFLRVPD